MKREHKHPIVAAGRSTGALLYVLSMTSASLLGYLLYSWNPWEWPSGVESDRWFGLVLVTIGLLLAAGGFLWLGFLFRNRLLFGVINEFPLVLSGLNEVEAKEARTAFRIGTDEALGTPGVGHVAWLGSGWYIVCAEAAESYAAFLARRDA